MKNVARAIVWLSLIALSPSFAQVSRLNQVFAQIAPVVHDKTSVPLRFPTQIRGLDEEKELFAITLSADASGYLVVLGATPECEGEHYCSYGALIGTKAPVKSIDFYAVKDRKGILVPLRHGIKGYFYEGPCGAYCSDSLIVWTEGSYHYIIGLRAGDKSELIKAANSALEARNRWR